MMARRDELAKWTVAALDNSNVALMHVGLASLEVVRNCMPACVRTCSADDPLVRNE
jgi:hypothetical protein